MDNTANLNLPYIAASQAQKHVTHNEALRALDALVQLGVLDRDLATPPASPAEGDRYIVASGASGGWAGKETQIAAFQNNAWAFYLPVEGWIAWVTDENTRVGFDGSGWSEISNGSVNPVSLVGVNTTASDPDKLSVKSNGVLFSHDDVTPGTGDMRAKLNKSASAMSASFVFQDNWSERAEMGLMGDDDFHFKVSPDGSTWYDAMVIDNATGATSFRFLDSQQLIIANNAVASVQPPTKGGIVFISIVEQTYPQAPAASIFSYDVGSSPYLEPMITGSKATNQGTTALTGITGPDGKINIAVDGSGNLYIENRYTTIAWQFCLTFINGYRNLP